MVRKPDDMVAFAAWSPPREGAPVGLVIPAIAGSAVVVN